MIKSGKNSSNQSSSPLQNILQPKPNPQLIIQSSIQSSQTTDPQLIMNIISSNRFKWSDQFQPTLSASITETNFETMLLQLHYGNLQMNIAVVFTHFEKKMLYCCEEEQEEDRGGFGEVRFCWFEGQGYAIKWIQVQHKENQLKIEQIYKEYFLCCLADVLGVGPKMLRLFGYDVVVSKDMAFFSMQKCNRANLNSPTLQSQLHQSLSTLHSLQFIHHDIKPQNIAYSQLRKKHVFIDFGLSKIIKQQKGKQTMTRFSGSISYCSEKMRNCRMLSQEMPVDLYENDLVGLMKSIGKGKQGIGIWGGHDHIKGEGQDLGEIGLQASLALILRLKFSIHKEDCEMVLKLFGSLRHLTKTVYQIFLISQIPASISQNPKIKKKLRTIAKFFSDLNFKSSQIDNIFCLVFSQSNKQANAQKIIPIPLLLKLKPNSLNFILSRTETVYKLFLFFDPCYNRCGSTLAISEMRESMVNKIWAARSSKLAEQPVFFCQKLRFVLIFFYDTLAENQNLKVMLSLRLLFVSIEDWSYVEKLEDKIIAVIDKPVLKILKIAEFSLFWDWLFQDFDHERKSQWTDIIKASTISERNVVEKKVRQLFSQLMVENAYDVYSNELKKAVLKKIIEVSNYLTNNEEKQSIYAIMCIYSEIARVELSQYTTVPRSQGIRIYSQFFKYFDLTKEMNQTKLYRVLQPIQIEFRNMFGSNPSKNLVISAIRHQFEINRKTEKYHNVLFFNDIKVGFIYKECVLEYFRQVKLTIQCCTSYKTSYSLFHHFLLIYQCISVLKFNMENATDEKICREEWSSLIAEISLLLEKIVTRGGVSSILAESNEVKIGLRIVQAQLAIETEKSQQEVKFRFFQILNMLTPLPYKFPNFMLFFIRILEHHQGHFSSKQHHYSKDIVVYLSQAYLKAKKYYFFEPIVTMFGLYIKIKIERGETENLGTILQFIEHFRQGKQFYSQIFHNRALIYATKMFCQNLPFQKLCAVYEEIRLNHLEMVCGLYGYFVFQVYLTIHEKLSFDMNFRQIARTILCLPKMSPICRKKVLPDLLRVARVTKIYRSFKELISSRLEGKLIQSSTVKKLKKKIEIKHKESTQQALNNLYSKIRNHNFNTNQKLRKKQPKT